MNERKDIDGKAGALMLLLCAILGLQQVVIKMSAADMSPVMQIALRSGGSALLMAAVVLWRRDWISWRATMVPGLLAGLMFALEYFFVAQALLYTSASHVVVFLYTAPVFAALLLHWRLPQERLTRLQWLGIALAFGGLVYAFFGGASGAGTDGGINGEALKGDFYALLAAMAWACNTAIVRSSRLSQTPAGQTMLYHLLVTFVLLTLAAFWMGQQHFVLTPVVWGSLLFQTLVVSFFSILMWFWLLRRYLASRLGVFSFLTPLFGVGFGVVLLNERLEPGFIVGALAVFAGIMLVSAHQWVARWLLRAAGVRQAK